MAVLGRITAAIIVLSYFVAPGFFADAAMTSTNYQVLWDSVGFGGSEAASSSSYELRDTIAGFVTNGSSLSYQEHTSFGGGVYDPIVKFNVYGQIRSSQVAATIFASTTVTVTTTSGYAVGNRIAVVQDEGASQVVAVGEVASLTATTLTVDFFATNGTSPTIDGTNDYVYRLASGLAMDLGTLSPTTVVTSVLTWEVSADVAQGYSVYLMENQNPTSSGTGVTISDVADGTVTAGSSEYGAVSSDASLSLSTFDTADTAITTSLQQVASRSDNTLYARDFVTLKVAVSSSLESATYSNTLSVIFVGDY